MENNFIADEIGSEEGLKSFDEAFLNFQRSVPSIPKDKFYKISAQKDFKYSSLEMIINTVRPELNKVGISLQQTIFMKDGDLCCRTILRFKGCQRWSKGYRIPIGSDQKMRSIAQAIGSDTTYSRRYDLCAYLGIVTEEDTDGVPDLEVESIVRKPKKEEGNKQVIDKTEKIITVEDKSHEDCVSFCYETIKIFKDPEKEGFWNKKVATLDKEGATKALEALLKSLRIQVKKT